MYPTDQAIVQVRTFVNGVDASTLSDDQVFKTIGNLEGEIAKLEAIQNKPKALTARIEKFKQDIQDPVDLLDERVQELS